MPTSKGLWNRNFLLLWQGQTVSLAGSSLSSVALALWVADVTGSPAVLGAILMAGSVVALTLTPFAGAVADRYSRVRILVACDLALGVAALGFAGAFLVHERSPRLALVALLVFQVWASAGNAFFATAARAITPDLVSPSRVPAANAAILASLQVAGMLGKGFGGLAYRLLGAPLLFLLDALTFFACGTAEGFIRVPPEPAPPAPVRRRTLTELLVDTRAGFSFVWNHEGLRTLTLVNACAAFFLDPLLLLLPFLVKDPRFLGATGDWYGYLLGGFSVGTLGGYGLAGVLEGRVRRRGGGVAGCLLLAGAGFAALGFARQPWAALALLAANGVFLGLFSNRVVSGVQTRAPQEMRARALGIFQTLSLGLTPLATGLAGGVAEALDRRVDRVFLGCGVAVCVIALWAASSKSWRGFLSDEGPPSASLAPSE